MRHVTKSAFVCTTTAIVLALGSMGCKELPGSAPAQGAVIGGAGGAATGAVIGGSHHAAAGAVIGGLLGAGAGYVIGTQVHKGEGHDKEADDAARRAQSAPATPQQALNATTADLNGDGFVTMDEVVAMKQAGLSDQQMIDRLRATGQVFELTAQQQDYLRNNGVDSSVIDQMRSLNRGLASTPPPTQPGVLNQPVPPPPAPTR